MLFSPLFIKEQRYFLKLSGLSNKQKEEAVSTK